MMERYDFRLTKQYLKDRPEVYETIMKYCLEDDPDLGIHLMIAVLNKMERILEYQEEKVNV